MIQSGKIRKYLQLFVLVVIAGSFPWLYFYLHHLLVTGLNPVLPWLIGVITAVVFVFIFERLYRLIKRNWVRGERNELMVLYASAVLFLIILQISILGASFDIHVHDTYYIISGKLFCGFVLVLFGLFFAITNFVSDISRRPLGRLLSAMHFWITFGVIDIFIASAPHQIMVNLQQSYFVKDSGLALSVMRHERNFYEFLLVLFILAQIIFIVHLFIAVTGRGKSPLKR